MSESIIKNSHDFINDLRNSNAAQKDLTKYHKLNDDHLDNSKTTLHMIISPELTLLRSMLYQSNNLPSKRMFFNLHTLLVKKIIIKTKNILFHIPFVKKTVAKCREILFRRQNRQIELLLTAIDKMCNELDNINLSRYK